MQIDRPFVLALAVPARRSARERCYSTSVVSSYVVDVADFVWYLLSSGPMSNIRRSSSTTLHVGSPLSRIRRLCSFFFSAKCTAIHLTFYLVLQSIHMFFGGGRGKSLNRSFRMLGTPVQRG